MTDRQRQIARHMLGLDNTQSKRSYRNRYCVLQGQEGFGALLVMWKAGLVTTRNQKVWHLTRAAAESVLLPGETLDAEDFPS